MRLRTAQLVTLAASASLLAAACQKKEAPAAKTSGAPAAASQPAAAKAEDEAPTRSLHKHMQEHFVKADNLKEAVIAGKVEQAQTLAKWMLEHPEPEGLPGRYEADVKRLKGSAKMIVDASGASEVAHGAAAMAAACAKCHASRGKTIEFGADPEPAAVEDPLKDHMARHTWAVTRMWDGVVGGSGELYTTGAKVLADLPVFAVSLKEGNKLMGVAADQMIEQLKSSAEEAAKAEDPQARAEVLGVVLSTCSNCHAMLDKGPE